MVSGNFHVVILAVTFRFILMYIVIGVKTFVIVVLNKLCTVLITLFHIYRKLSRKRSKSVDRNIKYYVD